MKALFRFGCVTALVLALAGFAAGPSRADVLGDGFLTVREGDLDNALVGFSVGTAGDVNGDGYSDVLLNGSENNGTVWCYLGAAAPNFSASAWTVNGETQNWLGSRVSTAGDVNGDGFDDVMIGAPIYANGESGEGAVYVYLGSSSGLSTTPQAILESNIVNAGFGLSIDTAGDVNGDGYDDIVIGAPRYANGQTSEGRAYLYLGSALGISATPAWSFESNAEWASLGTRVCGTGDVDADGYDDVLVAAPDLANGQLGEGRVYLFFGSPSGLPASASWTYESNVIGGRCGWGAGCAGDINADGYSDITFDTGSNNPATGAVLVFFGGASGPGASPNRTLPNNHGGFADVLYTAGDVNGDGCADLVASEMTASGNTGAISILGGWKTGTTLPILAVRNGQQASEQFGADVRPAGDVNGDGFADVIAGAPRFDHGQTDEGVVRLYLGRPSLPGSAASFTRDSTQDNSLYGYSVAQGDWNGDGYSDLAVGSPYTDFLGVDRGLVEVFYGSEAGYSATPGWSLFGTMADGLFGYSIADGGDVDNDGYDELLIGEPYWGEDNIGRAYLYNGSSAGLESSAAWTGTGETSGEYYGLSLSGAGDVNGDGYGDVIVGAPYHRDNQARGGRGLLYLGSSGGLNADPAWSHAGGADFDEFGRSVAGAGDVNGDGYADLVIGAPGMGATFSEGYVFVFFGSASGPAGSWTTHSNQVNARYGARVAAGGDVNGDGYSDILQCTPSFDGGGQTDRGIAEVYTGTPYGFLIQYWQRWGDQANDFFGSSLGGGGDVNNDGYSDVVVGATGTNQGSPDGGAAYLFLGSPNGVSGNPVWTRYDTNAFSSFGYSVSVSGDVTGDGFADMVIGQPYTGWSAGRVSCFYGSREGFSAGDSGVLRRPRQFRADGSTPVAVLGTCPSSDRFALSSMGRSARGRSTVQLEYQVARQATSWTGPPQSGGVFDTGAPMAGAGSTALAPVTTTGLDPNTEYHWRMRFRGDSPFFPYTPWFSIPGNGPDSDIRTSAGTSAVENVDPDGETDDGPMSGVLRFSRVSPNPANSAATLHFMSPQAGPASLVIHDVAGRRIAVLQDGLMERGPHSVVWNLRDDNGRDVPSGIYLARLTQRSAVTTTKVIVGR